MGLTAGRRGVRSISSWRTRCLLRLGGLWWARRGRVWSIRLVRLLLEKGDLWLLRGTRERNENTIQGPSIVLRSCDLNSNGYTTLSKLESAAPFFSAEVALLGFLRNSRTHSSCSMTMQPRAYGPIHIDISSCLWLTFHNFSPSLRKKPPVIFAFPTDAYLR